MSSKCHNCALVEAELAKMRANLEDYVRAQVETFETVQSARADAAEANVTRLREALHDQETGDNCWCDPADRDAELRWLTPDQHLDYCVSAREAFAATDPK